MNGLLAIAGRNLLNFSRDRMRLLFSLIMSVLFLFIFSFVMKGTGGSIEQPMNYLIAGVIIMTVFQQALNNSTEILTDLASGFMKEIIVSPIPRWQIAVGQVLSSATIAVAQGLIIVVIGFFLGLRLEAAQAMEMIGVMAVTGFTFASLGLFLATLARNSSAFQILTSVVVMPLTFLSGAYIPTVGFPRFLNVVVCLNPLTYVTAVFRYITLGLSGHSVEDLLRQGVAFDVAGFVVTPLQGLFVIIAMGLVFFALCVRKFDRADFSAVKVFRHRH